MVVTKGFKKGCIPWNKGKSRPKKCEYCNKTFKHWVEIILEVENGSS